MFKLLDDKHTELKGQGGDLPKELRMLKVLLETFLYRRVDNITSLWKRSTDFERTAQQVQSQLGVVEDEKGLFSFETLEKWDCFARTVLKPLRSQLEQMGVVLIHRRLLPKTIDTDPDTCVKLLFDDIDNPKAAHSCSPYLDSLRIVATNTPQIHISFVAEDIKRNQPLLDRCKTTTINLIVKYVRQLKQQGMVPA